MQGILEGEFTLKVYELMHQESCRKLLHFPQLCDPQGSPTKEIAVEEKVETVRKVGEGRESIKEAELARCLDKGWSESHTTFCGPWTHHRIWFSSCNFLIPQQIEFRDSGWVWTV